MVSAWMWRVREAEGSVPRVGVQEEEQRGEKAGSGRCVECRQVTGSCLHPT